jgi:hypothetical protein
MKNTLCKYPPYSFLIYIAKNCPKACLTYLLLWQLFIDNEKILYIRKQHIPKMFDTTLAKFLHNLKLLEQHNVLEAIYDEEQKRYHIIMFQKIESVYRDHRKYIAKRFRNSDIYINKGRD